MTIVTEPVDQEMALTALVVNQKIEYQKNRLVMRGALTPDEWAHLGRILQMMEAAVQWWVGDWALYGETLYGEQVAQYIEATGYSHETIKNQAWVASRFPPVRRRTALSWSHHQAVSALEVEQQERLLDWAEAPLLEGKTVRNVHALRNRAAGKFEYKELLSYETHGGLKITISRRRIED